LDRREALLFVLLFEPARLAVVFFLAGDRRVVLVVLPVFLPRVGLFFVLLPLLTFLPPFLVADLELTRFLAVDFFALVALLRVRGLPRLTFARLEPDLVRLRVVLLFFLATAGFLLALLFLFVAFRGIPLISHCYINKMWIFID
jgi:hypothetical protein